METIKRMHNSEHPNNSGSEAMMIKGFYIVNPAFGDAQTAVTFESTKICI